MTKAELILEKASYQKELDKYRKARDRAYDRMIEQRRMGYYETAGRSQKAYNYCAKYVSQLEHIIDGIEHRNSGCRFTKDAECRYVKRVIT